jgi:hypothetical protein
MSFDMANRLLGKRKELHCRVNSKFIFGSITMGRIYPIISNLGQNLEVEMKIKRESHNIGTSATNNSFEKVKTSKES